MKQIKMTLGFVLLTVGIITFTGCSKYEEGPGISFRTKKSRVTGEWKVTSFTEDGADILTSTVSDYFICISGATVTYENSRTINDYRFTLNNDGGATFNLDYTESNVDLNVSYANCEATYVPSEGTYTDSGKWEFASDKEEIKFTYPDGSTENWKILELKEKEMKLELTYGNSVDKMTLEKK